MSEDTLSSPAPSLPMASTISRWCSPELRPRAVAARYLAMDRLAPEGFDAREALRRLPPLIRGYLRLGGYVGDGAVIDKEFGTTDVCIVVKTDLVTKKYYRHYARPDPAKRPTA